MYDCFSYKCHPQNHRIFCNNHSLCCSMENTLSLHFPHNNDAGSVSLAEASTPFHFLSIPVPGSIPTWLTIVHVWHWCASAALSFLSRRVGGREVSVLNYHFFCFILVLKRRLYLFRCQWELKTLTERKEYPS